MSSIRSGGPMASRTSTDGIFAPSNNLEGNASSGRRQEIEVLLEQNKNELNTVQMSGFRSRLEQAVASGNSFEALGSLNDSLKAELSDIRSKNLATRTALSESTALLANSPTARLQNNLNTQSRVQAFFGATGAQGALRAALSGQSNPNSGV